MISVPFAPIGRETLRGFFDKLNAPVVMTGAFFYWYRSAAAGAQPAFTASKSSCISRLGSAVRRLTTTMQTEEMMNAGSSS